MKNIRYFERPPLKKPRQESHSAFGWISFVCLIYLVFIAFSRGPSPYYGGYQEILKLSVVAGLATGFSIHAIRFGRGMDKVVALLSACILFLFFWLLAQDAWSGRDWILDYYHLR